MKRFPEEKPQMNAAMFDFFQCEHSCTVGDIGPSLTSLKKYGPELKLFISIFGKLHQIKI